MPAPATHDFVHLEISSGQSVLNTGVNNPINYLIGRNLGSDDAIEVEDSLEILSGSGGPLPTPAAGDDGPAAHGRGGDAAAEHRRMTCQMDFHDGTNWDQDVASCPW